MTRWDKTTAGPRPEAPGVRKYAINELVPVQGMRSHILAEVLKKAECRAMAKLVERVHLDGYVGVSWPEIVRTPIRQVTVRKRGSGDLETTWREVHDNDLYPPQAWEIRARVTAVPRD